MQFPDELILTRDVPATIIPAGDPVTLNQGTRAQISQALGGTVTLRTDRGLFRVTAEHFDALGDAVAAQLKAAADEPKKASDEAGPLTEARIWDALRGCFDPEIPVNIVDLGLIYDLSIGESDDNGQQPVAVKMTLTAQGCGMGPVIAEDAKGRIEALSQVSTATVDIVWEPAWTPHMISDAGREKLGLS